MPERLRLVLLSFLMLFVELALIRWLGSNVIYLSYFSNFVLLGSFLGIGVGFLLTKSRFDFFRWTIVELAVLVGFVLTFPIEVNHSGSQLIYFGGNTTGLPIWVVLPIVFVVVSTVMASIAQSVGRAFARFAPLEAYRLDILGSLAGIVAFSALSFLGAPPVAWGAVVSLTILVLTLPRVRAIELIAMAGFIAMLGVESSVRYYTWSPYYKITALPMPSGAIDIEVNGVPHQWIKSIALRRRDEPLYFVPYQRLRHNPLRNVLIIGAGTGGDVAIALAHGAKHVDAVEIDPRIYELGQRMNPDHPYADPRVTVHIDDGRAFLQRTNRRYDLILLALPDSLALISGQSSLRLESYLFTIEAMRTARARLASDGVFGMYNFYREEWLIDRYARTLQVAYGYRPCIDFSGRAAALLTIGREAANVGCATTWTPSSLDVPEPVSDNYPFPYLRTPSIPTFYLVTLGAILIASLLMIGAAGGSFRKMSGYMDLFFMGAAFLLLETKNVVQFALLFGTTWFVNALVFAGILLSVLAAVEVSRRFQVRNTAALYAALFASLAIAWAVEPSRLLQLEPASRFAVAVALAFAPIFLANLVFAERFRTVSASTVAFSANLLGAMVGGILEYSALVFGYRDLLLLVAGLYAVAFLLRIRYSASVHVRTLAERPFAGSAGTH